MADRISEIYELDPIARNDKKPPQIDSQVEENEQLHKDQTVAGDYKMSECTMLTPNTENPIDMLDIVDSVTIYEDISKPYLLCDIAVRDGMGFRELAPLVGEEYIVIEAITAGFESPGPGPVDIMTGNADQVDTDQKVQKLFRVDSVSPIGNVTDRYKIYVIHCISLEAIISEKKKISKGYESRNIGEIVKEIYQNYIAAPITKHYNPASASEVNLPVQNYRKFFKPKKIWIEPTEGNFDFCFPFSGPFDIISDLAEKAEAASPEVPDDSTDPQDDRATDGALYMFYETLTQFKFESLESSFKRKPKRTFFSELITTIDPAADDKFMGRGDPIHQFNNIEEFRIDNLFNVIANLREGMYASKLITHDMIRMRYDLIGYRYTGLKEDVMKAFNVILHSTESTDGEAFEQAKKKLMDFTRSLGEGKLCSPKHDCLLDDGGEGSRVKLTGTNFNHDYYFATNRKAGGQGTNVKPAGASPGIKASNLERRVQKRDSQLQQLDNIRLTIKINGDSSLRVGDICNVKIPSTVDSENAKDYDAWLNGKYIMTKIKHVFDDERYTQEIQIRKDGFEQPLPAAQELADFLADADNGNATTAALIGELTAKDANFREEHKGKEIHLGDVQSKEERTKNLSGATYYDEVGRPIHRTELGDDGKPIVGPYFNSEAEALADYARRTGG